MTSSIYLQRGFLILVSLLLFAFTAHSQDTTPTPAPPPIDTLPELVLNERAEVNTTEADTYRLFLEEGQIILFAVQLVFDSCLQVADADGNVIITDRDVTEYPNGVLLPFQAPATADYRVFVGDFRCDPFGDERTFVLTASDGFRGDPWEVLGPEPLDVFVVHFGVPLRIAEITEGRRYRLTVTTDEDVPDSRTVYVRFYQQANDPDTLLTFDLADARYGEYVFEADYTGTAVVQLVYRLPNPSMTEGLGTIDATISFEELPETDTEDNDS